MYKVLCLEFNELCPDLVDSFIDAGELPKFQALRERSVVAVTDAGVRPPLLEPWIQWVTVHTGAPYAEHGCFNLNDGAECTLPRLWDMVSHEGRKVWVCGSMNINFERGAIRGHILPDPWASKVRDFPEGHFAGYVDFVKTFVHEHRNGPRPGLRAAARFGAFLLRNGLSAGTLAATAAQLVRERFQDAKWRRPQILDRIQWDVFRHVYRNDKPAFATMFLNSTAHFQHFHWREMDPDAFVIKPSAKELETYRDTILEGYRGMDRIVGEAMELVDDDTVIVLLTALSQQPMLTYEDKGGKRLHRHFDHEAVLALAGITDPCDYAPTMSQEFVLYCENEQAAARAEDLLRAIRFGDGRSVMRADRTGTRVVSACIVEAVQPEGSLIFSGGSNEAHRFEDYFYAFDDLRSGMHHPDGMLWVSHPAGKAARVERKIALEEVAPTLATILGLGAGPSFRAAPAEEIVTALAA